MGKSKVLLCGTQVSRGAFSANDLLCPHTEPVALTRTVWVVLDSLAANTGGDGDPSPPDVCATSAKLHLRFTPKIIEVELKAEDELTLILSL